MHGWEAYMVGGHAWGMCMSGRLCVAGGVHGWGGGRACVAREGVCVAGEGWGCAWLGRGVHG